jgi:hypothetical protein
LKGEKMNNFDKSVIIVTGIAELIVTASVGAVVGNLVKATTPDDLGRWKMLSVNIGGNAIGLVLGNLAAKNISARITTQVDAVKTAISPPPPEETVDPNTLSEEQLEAATAPEVTKKPKTDI